MQLLFRPTRGGPERKKFEPRPPSQPSRLGAYDYAPEPEGIWKLANQSKGHLSELLFRGAERLGRGS